MGSTSQQCESLPVGMILPYQYHLDISIVSSTIGSYHELQKITNSIVNSLYYLGIYGTSLANNT